MPLSERCFALFPRAHVKTHSAKVNHVNVQKIRLLDWPGFACDSLNKQSIHLQRERGGGGFPGDSPVEGAGKTRDRQHGEALADIPGAQRSLEFMYLTRVSEIYEHLPWVPRAVSLKLHCAPHTLENLAANADPQNLPQRFWLVRIRAQGLHFNEHLLGTPHQGAFRLTLRNTDTSLLSRSVPHKAW